MKTSYIFLAPGFEEIEALTVIDVMRRAGMCIKSVSIGSDRAVTGAHGITVSADMLFNQPEIAEPDWLIMPGGMPGATNLSEFAPLNTLLLNHASTGKIAAICAAPAVVLAPLGILDGKDATCYPGFEQQMPEANHCKEPVVTCGNIITANGPSSALPFALSIVAKSMGENTAKDVAAGMLLCPKNENFYL